MASVNPDANISGAGALHELARDMNPQADPCDDFYQYACGSWLNNTARPADVSSVSRGFSSLVERVDAVLQSIFRSDTPKISEFFAECTSYLGRNQQQAIPIQPWVKLIDEATTLEAIFFVIGRMHAFGMTPLFGFYVDIDPDQPDGYAGVFYPTGFGLEDPYLYLAPPPSLKFEYKKYISSLLELGGVAGPPDMASPDEQAQAVWGLEYNLLVLQLLSAQPMEDEEDADDAGRGPGGGRIPGGGPGPGGAGQGPVGGGVGGGRGAGGQRQSPAPGGGGAHTGGGIAGGVAGGSGRAAGPPHRGGPSAQSRLSALKQLKLPQTLQDFVDFNEFQAQGHAHASALAQDVIQELRSHHKMSPRPDSNCKKKGFAPCALWGSARAKGPRARADNDDPAQPRLGDIMGQPDAPTVDSLPWKEYFEGTGFPQNAAEVGKSIELHPALSGMAMLVPSVPVAMLQAYLKTQLLTYVQQFTTTDFLRVDYNWRLKMYALENPDEELPDPLTVSETSTLSADYMEDTCQEQITEMVPFLIGKHFSDSIFDVNSQKMSVAILQGVRNALRYGMTNEEHWMDAVTRGHALEKLDKMVDKIGYPGMHTAGESGASGTDARAKSDLRLLELVDDLYLPQARVAGETELHSSSNASEAAYRPRRRLKAAHEVAEPGPLALPLRLPARLKGGGVAASPHAASLVAPRKHYSQQQMQMGGFPPEAWEHKDEADGAASAPPPPFKLDDEVTQALPHQTTDPAELFAHYYGFFGKSMAMSNFAFRREMKKIGSVVDRGEWFMSPETVNAYYSPQWNEMVFPVAILQPPFFFKSFHPAMNFGSIGAIMGHEMTHGFDSNGRKFDKDGNQVDWWAPPALEEFLKRAQCVADLYSNFSEYGMNLMGANEVGENIADFGGVKFAFRAMKEYLRKGRQRGETFATPPNGLTDEQLFYVAYGQTWCTKDDPDFIRMEIQADEHSPAKERVNGPLASNPDFHQAFGCPVGRPMNPTSLQCRMW